MICSNADGVIKERFESLPNRYQVGLETLMRGTDFIFLLKIHKINPNRGVSYIDSPGWIKMKKATQKIKTIKK